MSSIVPSTSFVSKEDIIEKIKASAGRYPTGAEALSWYYANWFPMDKSFESYYNEHPKYVTYRLQPAFSFSETLIRASEGDSINVSVSIETTSTPSLSYVISPSDSITGSSSGSISFANSGNKKVGNVSFTINDDAALEQDEMITITFSNPSGGNLLTSKVTVIVNPSDVVIPSKKPVLSIRDPLFVFEDGTLITDDNYDESVFSNSIYLSYIIERSFIENDIYKDDFPTETTVEWNTIDLESTTGKPRATAIAGYDYTKTSGKSYFYRNERNVEIRVKVSSGVIESRDNYGASTIAVELKNPTGGELDEEASWCRSPSSYADKESVKTNTSAYYAHRFDESSLTAWRITTDVNGRNPKTEIWENGVLLASYNRGASMAEASVGSNIYFRSIGKKETTSETEIILDFALTKIKSVQEVSSTTEMSVYSKTGIKFFVLEEKEKTTGNAETFFVWDDIALRVDGVADSVSFGETLYEKDTFVVLDVDGIRSRSYWKIKRNKIVNVSEKYIPLLTARIPEVVSGFLQTTADTYTITPDDRFCVIPFEGGTWWWWLGFPYKTDIPITSEDGPKIKTVRHAENDLGYTVIDEHRGLILRKGKKYGNRYSVYSESFYGTDLIEPTSMEDFKLTANLSEESDTGISKTDKITNDTTPTLVGSCMAGSLVQARNSSGSVIGEASCSVNNTYSITTNTLETGTQLISMSYEDVSGFSSYNSISVEVDTTTSGTCSISVYVSGGVARAIISGWIEEGSTVNTIEIFDILGASISCELENVVYGINGNWSFSIEPVVTSLELNDTILILKVYHTDVAGNTSLSEATSNPANKFLFVADWMLVSYSFSDGNDMDTRTKITIPKEIGGDYSGWGRSGQSFQTFGGDNKGTGYESVLVNVKGISDSYPNKPIVVEYRAGWYGRAGRNPVVLSATFWKGGTPIKSGFTWYNNTAEKTLNLNSLGTVITEYIRSEGSIGQRVALATYDPLSGTGYLVNK